MKTEQPGPGNLWTRKAVLFSFKMGISKVLKMMVLNYQLKKRIILVKVRETASLCFRF